MPADIMAPVTDDIIRARHIGVTLDLSDFYDRLPPDRRNPATACGTCDDGVLTITHPNRCKACEAEGL